MSTPSNYNIVHINKDTGENINLITPLTDRALKICRGKMHEDYIKSALGKFREAFILMMTTGSSTGPGSYPGFTSFIMFDVISGMTSGTPCTIYIHLVCSSEKGHGKKLIEELERYGKEHKCIDISLQANPEKNLIKFYSDCGFRVSNTIIDRHTGEPALYRMNKEL